MEHIHRVARTFPSIADLGLLISAENSKRYRVPNLIEVREDDTGEIESPQEPVESSGELSKGIGDFSKLDASLRLRILDSTLVCLSNRDADIKKEWGLLLIERLGHAQDEHSARIELKSCEAGNIILNREDDLIQGR